MTLNRHDWITRTENYLLVLFYLLTLHPGINFLGVSLWLGAIRGHYVGFTYGSLGPFSVDPTVQVLTIVSHSSTL